MDTLRVKEILNLENVVDVFYQGNYVWIEGVNNNIATITKYGTKEVVDVPVEMLEEHGFTK